MLARKVGDVDMNTSSTLTLVLCEFVFRFKCFQTKYARKDHVKFVEDKVEYFVSHITPKRFQHAQNVSNFINFSGTAKSRG